MARVEHDQILEPPRKAPIAIRIDFTLVAGVKPASFEHFGRFFRTLPVTGKNVRPAHQDFSGVHHLHLRAGNCESHAARPDPAGLVHGADRGGFREPVDLQHRDTEHHEE